MAASPTVYCLEKLTDYREFERLCHDIMVLEGYPDIEPLGGSNDKGRDALSGSRAGSPTVFAYSVREDWQAKLAEDAAKVKTHGHLCQRLVFVTTADISASERDQAKARIQNRYGWELELFPIERLRLLLESKHAHLKSHYPQIFPPAFLALEVTHTAVGQRDHILIIYAPADRAPAEWLARKLAAEGYFVWLDRLNSIARDPFPDDIDDAIRQRAVRVIALYSQSSLKDPEAMHLCSIAIAVGKRSASSFFMPVRTERIPSEMLDTSTRALIFTPLDTDWAEGLRLLAAKLSDSACPKSLPEGRSVAAAEFLGRDVISKEEEDIVTNCLPIKTIPDVIWRFTTEHDVPKDTQQELGHQWAYRSINDKTFLSFHQPPPIFRDSRNAKLSGQTTWRNVERIDGIQSRNIVAELINKSLRVKCRQRGLQLCEVTGLLYFPLAEGAIKDRLPYRWPDGSAAWVQATGERKYRSSATGERYRYYLAPSFFVSRKLLDEFAVLLWVRVRITDTKGLVLPKHKGNSRRKDLCKEWWNNDWLSRLMAISQYLADDGQIVIGEQPTEKIVISAVPLVLTAPRRIDEARLDQLARDRESLIDTAGDTVDPDADEGIINAEEEGS